MPCVCLRNTFRYWQALKAQNLAMYGVAQPKSSTSESSTSVPAATNTRLQDSTEILYIPHPRKPLFASPTATTPSASLGHTTPPFESLSLLSSQFLRATSKPSRADLINAESQLGSTIFGPIPAGHRREFFHDRENVWIWHEDWQDENQHPCQFTVRYEVRNSGIYKKVATGKYLKLEGDELTNFRKATYSYLCLVKKYLYHTPQITNAA